MVVHKQKDPIKPMIGTLKDLCYRIFLKTLVAVSRLVNQKASKRGVVTECLPLL